MRFAFTRKKKEGKIERFAQRKTRLAFFLVPYCSRVLYCRMYSGGKQSAYCSSIKERDFPDSIAKGSRRPFADFSRLFVPRRFVKAIRQRRIFTRMCIMRNNQKICDLSTIWSHALFAVSCN